MVSLLASFFLFYWWNVDPVRILYGSFNYDVIFFGQLQFFLDFLRIKLEEICTVLYTEII
jgi:hypothetical protein